MSLRNYKHKKTSTYFTLSLLLFLTGCVDLYDPKIETGKRRLVVESQLSTKEEFQYVYLTTDAGYNSEETNFKFLVEKAEVSIVDNAGNTYAFFDDLTQNNQIKTSRGYNYRSLVKFKAVLGRTYTLRIKTLDGKLYESSAELVVPVTKIDKVRSVFYPIINPSTLSGNFTVSIDVQDVGSRTDYYMWRSYHVKQLKYCREWYVFGSGGSVTVANIDDCCGLCYEKEICEDCFELGNDKLINGKKIVNQFIATVPHKTSTPYYMVISQYSLNEKAYKYWNAIKQQSKNSGGLFDATPQSLKGNIVNKTDSNEEVLGFFTVSDVHDEIVVINRNVPGVPPVPYEEYATFNKTGVCYPCEENYKRTRLKPAGFINY
jgi:hypothetical protein